MGEPPSLDGGESTQVPRAGNGIGLGGQGRQNNTGDDIGKGDMQVQTEPETGSIPPVNGGPTSPADKDRASAENEEEEASDEEETVDPFDEEKALEELEETYVIPNTTAYL